MTVHEFEGDLDGEKVAIRITDCGPDYRLPLRLRGRNGGWSIRYG